ncbi:MAG TPA: hypothetical protein VKG01_12200 [Thermoanaerobaculia bacterium]|nr:hypothetical protein [Thermoanaerobaculia bacterium]
MSSLPDGRHDRGAEETFFHDDTKASRRAEALRLIEEAETLGVPWKQVLEREVLAEGMLQRFLGAPIRDLPLWRALSVIPASLFHSWRVRETVDRLCHEASTEGSRAARQELASLLESVCGPHARRAARRVALSKHYRFAYDRVLELQAVALAAEKGSSSGLTLAAEVREATGCSRSDADWAVSRLTSPSRTHALDSAVRHAREEGFEIPPAASELQAFSRLKRFVSRHRPFAGPFSGRRRIPVSRTRSAVHGDDLRKNGDRAG